MKKIGFVSLGCPKNLVDSEVMMGLLAGEGYEITPRAEEAEVLVVNTCSFIESAQQESVDAILEMAELKKSGRARRLIVAGCLVERYRSEIQRDIPEIDALVGTNELPDILRAVNPESKTLQPAPAMMLPTAGRALTVLPAALPEPVTAPYLYDELTPRLRATAGHTAYIKIAEGCDHPCAFCVIPHYRGKFRSRRPESVLAEARRLAAEGVREIVLIGQDTTCYGEDLGLRDGLAGLLAQLAGIEELAWIRTLYFYPNKVTTRLLETIAAHPRLCKYIDMPLQHASPAVLKRMRRGGTGEHFLRLLEKIRSLIPGVALRTTFITGFPGETAAEFAELCDFVAAAEFDWMGVFGYSDEATSQAHQLADKVDEKTVAARRDRLMRMQKKISRRRRRAEVGRRVPVLVEGPSREADYLWEGRLEGQAPEIDGKIWLSEFPGDQAPRPGQIVTAEIIAAHDYDLVARVL